MTDQKIKVLKNPELINEGGKKDNIRRTDRVRLSMTGKRINYYLKIIGFVLSVTQAEMDDLPIPNSNFEPTELQLEIDTLLKLKDDLHSPLTEEILIEDTIEDEDGLAW